VFSPHRFLLDDVHYLCEIMCKTNNGKNNDEQRRVGKKKEIFLYHYLQAIRASEIGT